MSRHGQRWPCPRWLCGVAGTSQQLLGEVQGPASQPKLDRAAEVPLLAAPGRTSCWEAPRRTPPVAAGHAKPHKWKQSHCQKTSRSEAGRCPLPFGPTMYLPGPLSPPWQIQVCQGGVGITASGAPALQGDLGHATLSAVTQFPGCKMGKSEPWQAGGEEKGSFLSWGVEGAACCPPGGVSWHQSSASSSAGQGCGPQF